MKTLNLEEKLMGCWCITEDLDTLFEYVMEAETLDRDFISNYLLGLKTIYDLKHSKCFEEFEKVIRENQ